MGGVRPAADAGTEPVDRSGDVLSPEKPVTLTWDNDNGLVFTTHRHRDDLSTFDDVIPAVWTRHLRSPYGTGRRGNASTPASIFFMKARSASSMKR